MAPASTPDLRPVAAEPGAAAAADVGSARWGIEAVGIGRRFGKRWALAGVDVRLGAGRCLLLLGPNGSGKTTLLKVLSTAQAPTLGTLRVLGRDARTEKDAIRRDLALLSHGSHLYDALDCRENLDLACQALGVDDGPDRVRAALQRVGLDRRVGDPVRTYSAGMRKRLAFARLLVQRPRLALIDEPYGTLDQAGFDLVDTLVAELKASGATVVVATHLAERGAALCDDALILKEGRVLFHGAAAAAPARFRALGVFE